MSSSRTTSLASAASSRMGRHSSDRVVQPARDEGADVPPTFSGYPSEDRSGWDDFRAEFNRSHRELWVSFDEWMQSARRTASRTRVHPRVRRAQPVSLPGGDRLRRSTAPSRRRGSVRFLGSSDGRIFRFPDHRPAARAASVYLSLGSLAAGDVELMQRLVDVLSATTSPLRGLEGSSAPRIRVGGQHVGRRQFPAKRRCFPTWTS